MKTIVTSLTAIFLALITGIAIFAEAFFGSIQNIINVLGDIVTVAIEEQKYQKQPA